MKLAKKITDILEERGINIISTEPCGDEYRTELEFWSNAGEGCYYEIYHDGTEKSFADAFYREAADFDPDEHAEELVNMRGTNGVPNSIREIIDDADSIKEFLEETADALRTA
jgi:hypothetical protein